MNVDWGELVEAPLRLMAPTTPTKGTRSAVGSYYLLFTKGPTGSGHVKKGEGLTGQYICAKLLDLLDMHFAALLPEVRRKGWMTGYCFYPVGLHFMIIPSVVGEAAKRILKEGSVNWRPLRR